MEEQEAHFGVWLLEVMAGADVSQAELARRTGRSTGVVSAWVSGKKRPEIDSLKLIADALGISLDVVLAAAGHRQLREPVSRYEVAERIREMREQLRQLEVRVMAEGGVRVPLLGRVPADSLRWTAAYQGRTIEVVESELRGATDPFAVEITGDCMRAIGILPGDIVICDRSAGRPARNGQLVVVRVAGEMTFKRWIEASGGVELQDGDGTVRHRVGPMDDVEVVGFYITYKPVGRR